MGRESRMVGKEVKYQETVCLSRNQEIDKGKKEKKSGNTEDFHIEWSCIQGTQRKIKENLWVDGNQFYCKQNIIACRDSKDVIRPLLVSFAFDLSLFARRSHPKR